MILIENKYERKRRFVMRRKIYNELLEWKKENNGKTAILIDGARRVGKSYIAEMFAKENYKSYILIDFSKVSNVVKELFDNYLDNLDYLFTYLSGYFGIKLYERKSLFIFDEVQFCPRARSAIKHLVADGRYDYIETGSLISIKKNVKDILIPSEERKINMKPMDFEEFMWAMGNDTMVDLIKQCFNDKKPLTPALHRRAMDCFKEYLIIGGMPQAVKEYSETRDFEKVDQIKRDILGLYREDIRKYGDEIFLKAEQIFDEIPNQLQKHEKKFNLSAVDTNARYREYNRALYWLEDAGLVNIAYNTSEPNIGLGLNRDSNSFKCYMFDTGLLLSMAFNERNLVKEEIYKKILFDKLTFNEGMIIENVVAQMLVAAKRHLYFFSRNNRENSEETMEIDFLIDKSKITSKHNIIPIEVKSGKNYTFSSLNKFHKKYKVYLTNPIIIHQEDLKVDDAVLYLPIYMTGLL